MDIDEIKRRMRDKGLKNVDLAAALGIAQNKISKSLSGERRFQVAEVDILREMLSDGPRVTGAPVRAIPIVGSVTAGNWREAVANPIGSMPSPHPDIPPRAFGLAVSGDSMDKYVQDGGTVVVDPDDRTLFPNQFYVVENGEGETTFKQFKTDPARMVPCSTNPSHKEIVIGSEAFQVIARVIWAATRM